MNLEKSFLDKLAKLKCVKLIGSDCVYIRHKNTISIGKDLFYEDVHFKKSFCNDYLITKKAFLVNISDILASGASPKYALLGISLNSKSNQKEILKAIQDICKDFNITLIGGDTIKASKFCISLTLIGEVFASFNRASARSGDFLAYTSSRKKDLGECFKSLRSALRYDDIRLSKRHERFLLPALRARFLKDSKKLINSCMDISDGLNKDLKEFLKANKIGIKPFFRFNTNSLKFISAEEYEPLFSFKAKNLAALKLLAKKNKLDIHVLGKLGRYKRLNLKTNIWH